MEHVLIDIKKEFQMIDRFIAGVLVGAFPLLALLLLKRASAQSAEEQTKKAVKEMERKVEREKLMLELLEEFPKPDQDDFFKVYEP